MALTTTKTLLAFQASASNAAAATLTGSSFDLTAADGCIVIGKVTNGGTGPTLGCRFRVQISNDNSNWSDYSSETAPTTNSAATFMQAVYLGPEVMYARTVFDSNTGQTVTCQADGSKVVFT